MRSAPVYTQGGYTSTEWRIFDRRYADGCEEDHPSAGHGELKLAALRPALLLSIALLSCGVAEERNTIHGTTPWLAWVVGTLLVAPARLSCLRYAHRPGAAAAAAHSWPWA